MGTDINKMNMWKMSLSTVSKMLLSMLCQAQIFWCIKPASPYLCAVVLPSICKRSAQSKTKVMVKHSKLQKCSRVSVSLFGLLSKLM